MNVQADVVQDLPEGSELLASWNDTVYAQASSDKENASQNISSSNFVPQHGSSASSSTEADTQDRVAEDQRATSGGRRKRPATSVLQQLLDLHKEEAATAAKAAKKSRELMKQGLKLQTESNVMQSTMVQLLQQHFAARDNK
ncbi:hypothetical protein HPB49_001843 [Dermacentor silvarum]|uniref:Uncharacterized protein n=1 Tax=Dermacentor silvarum TaxID=543639 RepID=A0ACB8C1Z9_DERSI|nr:hypothetical protein HPB49_001843 [Dermacentor silvarum]